VLTFGGDDDRPVRLRRAIGLAIGLAYLPTSNLIDDTTGDRRTWAITALAVFVACLLGSAMTAKPGTAPRRHTIAFWAVASVVAVVSPPLFGGGWLGLSVYLTVPFGLGLPAAAALVAVVGVVAVVFVNGFLIGYAIGGVVLIAFVTATFGFLFVSVGNTRRLVAELRRAQREVARLAADEERLRISRDLHDLLGHSLSLIVLKSELAGRLAEQGSARTLGEIRDVETVARKALVEVREAVGGYRRRGLAEELDNARAALETAGMRVTVTTSGTPLPDHLEDMFGWAVREGATNVVRHARATHCRIAITYSGGSATLEVSDDGTGPPAGRGRASSASGGSGLAGLAERVTAAGGRVTAGPGPAGGFRLRAVVPALTP
jgi:two-component system sensor histidine kinase DesK